MRSIGHDEKRDGVLHAKFKDAHNMWVIHADAQTRFVTEVFDLISTQFGRQDFHRRLCSKKHMLCQIDLSEASFSKHAKQTIVPKLLTRVSSHHRDPPARNTMIPVYSSSSTLIPPLSSVSYSRIYLCLD